MRVGLQALQAEGAWHEAERHFCEAKEWKGAVAMYRQQGAWEDALRVARVLGGQEAATQVGSSQIKYSVRHMGCGSSNALLHHGVGDQPPTFANTLCSSIATQ